MPMSDKGFEFSGFISAPVEREFLPREGMKEGEGVKLMLNLDYLTIERMDQLDAKFNKMFDGSLGILKAVDKAVSELATEDEPDPTPKTDAIAKRGKKKLPVAATKPAPATPAVPQIELFVFEKARARFYAETLAGEPGNTDPEKRLIHGWNVVRDGEDVPICYESFIQMPPHGLTKLYRFVIGAANNPTSQEKKQ